MRGWRLWLGGLLVQGSEVSDASEGRALSSLHARHVVLAKRDPPLQVVLPEALSEKVALFCAESTSAEESTAARDSITASVRIWSLTVLKVVEASQACLTSTDNDVRNRGTMLLADVLESLPDPDQGGGSLNEVELTTLLGFFTDRLKDEPCVREVLRATANLADRCTPAASLSPELADALVQAVDSVFGSVHVQALALSDRRNAYIILQAAVERGAPIAPAGPEGAAMGLTHAMDGERDPRNLTLCFKLVQHFVKAGACPRALPCAAFMQAA